MIHFLASLSSGKHRLCYTLKGMVWPEHLGIDYLALRTPALALIVLQEAGLDIIRFPARV
jgi:hypothetical protein